MDYFPLIIFIILWVATGVLSWGWVNYCSYLHDKEKISLKLKLTFLIISMVAWPAVLMGNLITCFNLRKFYFGLRFR